MSSPTEEGVRPGIDVQAARASVARHARVTPLVPAIDLSHRLKRRVLVKAESLQRTGSFKVRGAAARLEALDARERAAGVVACSSGNHGRAVAFVAQRLDVPATVFVPTWVDPVKLEGIRASGADAVLAGETFDESEALAVAHASENGTTYVSAYDDPRVIAGQGSLGLEVVEQLGGTRPHAIIAALSGGGLLGGIASGLQGASGSDGVQVVGASARNASVMLASLEAGRPVELPEQDTLANALAGGIGLENRWSFDLIRRLVHEHVDVTEEEIRAAMCYAAEHLRLVVEGGGAVGLAAVLSGRWAPEEAPDEGAPPVVIVASGGNVSLETLAEVLGTPARAATGSG